MDSSPADRPVFVLQRAGDNRSTWHRALAGPADHLEVGVRLQRGRAVSQHDPLVHPRLPFLTQRNQAPRLRIPVRALELGEARAPGRIFLDLKGLIPTLLGALERSGSRSGALASTPIWAQLERLAEQAPEIERYYTVRPREAASGVWESYLRRAEEGRGGVWVSLHCVWRPGSACSDSPGSDCAPSAIRSTMWKLACAFSTPARRGLLRTGSI